MAYFIFQKNLDNIEGSLYKIAENEVDFDNLNIIDSDYKIIQDSQSNFNEVKYRTKNPISYSGDTINYSDNNIIYNDKNFLKSYRILIRNFVIN